MAIREIRVVGDLVLTKKCRPVEKMTPRISELIDDMFDTMYEANGVGLAAPQEEVLAGLREKLERYIEINKGFRTVYLQFDFSRKY